MTESGSTKPKREYLGSVSCPSGALIILDGGWAWLWSHDRSPVVPGLPAAREDASDLFIRGRDAIAAAELNGSAVPYLFDQPGDELETLRARFSASVADHGLDAAIEVFPTRIPRRKRADLVLEAGRGMGVVEFGGMTAIVLGGMAPDRLFPIRGERMEDGPVSPNGTAS